jgi:hypothetical protein
MKPIRLLAVLFIVMLASCKLDPPYMKYYDVPVYITGKTIPSSSHVDEPVNLTFNASAPNGCYSDIHFLFAEKADKHYELVALATYESHGTCTDALVIADTLITLTPHVEGDYVITTWVSPYNYERDTLAVTVPMR